MWKASRPWMPPHDSNLLPPPMMKIMPIPCPFGFFSGNARIQARLRKPGGILLPWIVLHLAAGFAMAQPVIKDDFSNDGPLAGRLPSPVDNGYTWYDAASDGSVSVTGGQLKITGGLNSMALAIDPFAKNKVYRLSVDVIENSTDWVGLGFFNVADPEPRAREGIIGPIAIADNSRGQLQLYPTGEGPYGARDNHIVDSTPVVGRVAIELAVDWTGAAAIEFFWNGVSIHSGNVLSAEEVGAIRAVGLVSTGNGTPRLDNFVFEVMGDTQALRSSIVVEGDELVLRGSNGPPHGSYQVLRSPDLALPKESWSDAGLGVFDSTGSFRFAESLPVDAPHFYQLTVYSDLSSPEIVAHPEDDYAFIGDTVEFSVSARGAPPLSYQWYYNADTILTGQTSATLTLTNVGEADAGDYSVMVSNPFGNAESHSAKLSATANNGGPIGWASLNGGTTGGAGGTTVVVSTGSEFEDALNSSDPMTIVLSGTVSANFTLQGKSNKTIKGLNADSGWNGFVQFRNCHNFIIKNCNIGNSGSDGITIQDSSTNFWVDHCTFGDAGDGQIDIVHGSDYVTVSWCKFIYTNPENDHRLSSLIGSSSENGAENSGRLNVTFHHNWWSDLSHGRMPRVRFGKVHVFNNYYSIPNHDGYCIVAAWESQLLIENNYFHMVHDPYTVTDVGAGNPGRIKAVGNIFDQTTGSTSPGNDTVFTPPYPYNLEAPSTARDKIIAEAGNTF